ncbi:hypothetical protein [Marinitoga sp. 1138]|uniref:hypothetical protein n=1 Tax=Marinitoga sp. 1138 TaxID=1643334 RepID=UPI0015868BD1|nr:hypothetical protein [Marinitoga sp. 1138]NUU97727.1 hypothetical protein [Marinitoga sp. 1138]
MWKKIYYKFFDSFSIKVIIVSIIVIAFEVYYIYPEISYNEIHKIFDGGKYKFFELLDMIATIIGFIIPIFLLLIDKFLYLPFSVFKILKKEITNIVIFIVAYYTLSAIFIFYDINKYYFVLYGIGILFILYSGEIIWNIIEIVIVQETISEKVLESYKEYIKTIKMRDEDE